MGKSESLAPLQGQVGFVPPRYQRGKRTADALLDSGRRLLRCRPFDAVTVEELCSGAQVTTGAFYRRFDSKSAYFDALRALALDDGRAAVAQLFKRLDSRQLTLAEGMRLIMRTARLWHCRHEGVIRASMTRSSATEETWEPIKLLARNYVEEVAPRVLRMTGVARDDAAALRVRFAFQMAFGTMVNAIANDPGPLRLSDSRLDMEIAEALTAYLGAKSPTPA